MTDKIKEVILRVNGKDKKIIDDVKITRDRTFSAIKSVAAHFIPDLAIIDQKKNAFDCNIVRKHFLNQGKLSFKQLLSLIKKSSEIMSLESNVVHIDTPAYIIGDIHGQYYDLLTILDQIDLEKETVVFLGDYVDRGSFSAEVYFYLLVLKCNYPKNVILLRGNHETESMTQYFTFKKEMEKKYSLEAYKLVLESFNALPLAAIIQKKAFCSHGGIPKEMPLVKQIDGIYRFQEPPTEGPFCDILWSDPCHFYNYDEKSSWSYNTQRRCSYFYGYKAVCKFLENNNLTAIFRGHEVQENGITYYKNYRDNQPSVTTIFSAPNYCDSYNNLGGFVYYDNKIVQSIRFEEVEHPYVLPGFSDAITWSLPYIYEETLEFGVSILAGLSMFGSDSSVSSSSENDVSNIVSVKEEIKKNIVIERVNREMIDEFIDEESTVSCCHLENPETDINTFEEARNLDSVNEEIKVIEDSEAIDRESDISPSLLTSDVKKIIENDGKSLEVNVVTDEEKDVEKIEVTIQNEFESLSLSETETTKSSDDKLIKNLSDCKNNENSGNFEKNDL